VTNTLAYSLHVCVNFSGKYYSVDKEQSDTSGYMYTPVIKTEKKEVLREIR